MGMAMMNEALPEPSPAVAWALLLWPPPPPTSEKKEETEAAAKALSSATNTTGERSKSSTSSPSGAAAADQEITLDYLLRMRMKHSHYSSEDDDDPSIASLREQCQTLIHEELDGSAKPHILPPLFAPSFSSSSSSSNQHHHAKGGTTTTTLKQLLTARLPWLLTKCRPQRSNSSSSNAAEPLLQLTVVDPAIAQSLLSLQEEQERQRREQSTTITTNTTKGVEPAPAEDVIWIATTADEATLPPKELLSSATPTNNSIHIGTVNTPATSKSSNKKKKKKKRKVNFALVPVAVVLSPYRLETNNRSSSNNRPINIISPPSLLRPNRKRRYCPRRKQH
jgi:hypothetical protein